MYFITTVEVKDDKKQYKRCVGYVETFEDAERIVTENLYDIYEYCYQYAVIEEIHSGIYEYDTKPTWYYMDYENDKVIKLDKRPDFARNIVGWAIG